METAPAVMSSTERDLALAKMFLQQGLPLPVDLTTRLLAAGVDVLDLEQRFHV